MKCTNRLALTMSGVIRRSLDDVEGLQSSNYEGYQIFERDDLVFKLIDLENIKTSRVGIVPEKGIMSPAYILVRRNGSSVYPRYAYWFYTNLYLQHIFNQLGGGVRKTLGSEELLENYICVPSTSEQHAVVKFLDRETARIDLLIEKQEGLIALLEEKRQAVISHAVTKGLDPDAPTKDSGIEWLGEIPAHWEVRRVKHAVSFMTSGSRGWSQTFADEGELFLQSGNIGRNMEVNISNAQRIEPQTGAEARRTTLRPDDVLVCITGGRTGAVGYVAETN